MCAHFAQGKSRWLLIHGDPFFSSFVLNAFMRANVPSIFVGFWRAWPFSCIFRLFTIEYIKYRSHWCIIGFEEDEINNTNICIHRSNEKWNKKSSKTRTGERIQKLRTPKHYIISLNCITFRDCQWRNRCAFFSLFDSALRFDWSSSPVHAAAKARKNVVSESWTL